MFQRHPYTFLFAGAGAVLIIILLSIKSLSTPSSINIPQTYVNGGTIPVPQNIPTTPETPLITRIPPIIAAPTTTPAQISHPAAASSTPVTLHTPSSTTSTVVAAPLSLPTTLDASDSLLQFVYSLVPSGVNAPTTKTRTPDQQALFEYGNQAGLAITTFENGHTDMADVLKVWLANRTNASAVTSANALADALTEAGSSLENLSHVPASARAGNAALAHSLKDAGGKLRDVVVEGNTTDLALLSAIRSYNTAADTFTQNYVALSTIFSLSNVTFSGNDLGSAFQFPSGGQ